MNKVLNSKTKIIAAVIITIAVEGCTAKTSNSAEIEKTPEASASSSSSSIVVATSTSSATASPSSSEENNPFADNAESNDSISENNNKASADSDSSNTSNTADSSSSSDTNEGCVATYHPAVTHVVHHDEVSHIETQTIPAVTHEEEYTVVESHAVFECKACHQQFNTYDEWTAHQVTTANQGDPHGSWREAWTTPVLGTRTVVDSPESSKEVKIVDSAAWDETVTDSEAYTGC